MRTVTYFSLFHGLLMMLALLPAPPLHAAQAPHHMVEIADVGKSREFAEILAAKGVSATVPAKNIWVMDPQSNCVVWIGKKVPLEVLRVVLPEALSFNPHLKFFHVVGDRGELPPESIDNTVHIGGNVEAALVKKLNMVDAKELLETLGRVRTVEELHRYLHDKNIPASASASVKSSR